MPTHMSIAAALLLALGASLAFGGAQAAERQTFTQARFSSAQAAGDRILVDISAVWCPTCKAQKPIVQSLSELPANKDLVILDVDFDTQKDVVAALGARMQSTLIAYKGNSETGRSVGETDPAALEALFNSNLAH